MSIFASTVLWNGLVRVIMFWTLVGVGLAVLAGPTPYSDWRLVFYVLEEVGTGNISRLAEKDFAFGLSSAIVQVALALAFAFLIAHVVLLRTAVYAAKRELGRANDLRDFAANFATIAARLRRNAIIKHSWCEFEKTLVREDDAVRNTVRPQAFINLGDARERLFGLKMIGAIPGFFVGLGLLLTFIGLVLALNNAVGSTEAGSAEEMKASLNTLLAAATFKFSTSIAGLGASLVLSLLFRMYQIWTESSFDGFGRALEERMLFHPAQRIAVESRDILAAQRDELKEINSETFFARLGQSVAPRIEGAVSAALRPVTERLDNTMGQLTKTSQNGLDEMLKGFLDSLRGGAGVELIQVTRSLDAVRGTLEGVQQHLAGSSADFAQRFAEASETMSRVVAEAGRTLGGSASGVAGTVEAAMAGVVQKLETQTTAFGDALTTLQAGLAAQAEGSARASREAGEAAAEASRRAVQDAAAASTATAREVLETVRTGMSEVVDALRDDIGLLSETLRLVSAAFAGQTQQIEAVSARSRDTADAFSRVATDVRSASQPLVTHSESVANSTERMAASITSSVTALSTTQEAARAIAEQLSAHLNQIGGVWDQYEARFKSVDEDLGKAADRFHDEVSRHQEAMRDFVKNIDEHTGSILGKINTAVIGLGESVESLNETLDGFLQTMAPRQAAE